MISFRCEECDSRLTLEDKFAGAMVKCPRCGWVNEVPQDKPVPVNEAVHRTGRGRKWRRPERVPRSTPLFWLAAALDGFVSRLSLRSRKSAEGDVIPALHRLAALAATTLLASTLIIVLVALSQFAVLDKSITWMGAPRGGAAVWHWLVMLVLTGLAGALIGYIFAASSCNWLRRDIVLIDDPTVLHGAMLLCVIAAAALALTGTTVLFKRTEIGVSTGLLLAACFLIFAAYLLHKPGLIGVRIINRDPDTAEQPVLATGLAVFEVISKTILMLGIVGFVFSAGVVFVGWFGGTAMLAISSDKADEFRRWGARSGLTGVRSALLLPAAGYLGFLIMRLGTGFGRAALRIANELTLIGEESGPLEDGLPDDVDSDMDDPEDTHVG